MDSRCVLARENRGSFLAVYVAKVRITVQADGSDHCPRRSRFGRGPRAPPRVKFTTLPSRPQKPMPPNGRWPLLVNRSDLSFTARTRSASSQHSPTLQPTIAASPPQPRVGLHPDDTTPIPRPSHYYGRRHQGSMTELLRRDQAKPKEYTTASPTFSARRYRRNTTKIDKSQLTIAEPKRLRDKAHLKFVASQPCLICGRQPSDPHHLQFARPQAMGLKVSDEFTVPLCRGHHRQGSGWQ